MTKLKGSATKWSPTITQNRNAHKKRTPKLRDQNLPTKGCDTDLWSTDFSR